MTAVEKPSAIRRRLIRLILVTSMVVVGLTCVAFYTYEVVTFRRSMIRHDATLAQVIATNSTAALAFENPADARDVLAAFKADPSIRFAALLRSNGTVLARYPGSSQAEVPAIAQVDGVYFQPGAVVARVPVIQAEQRLGTLVLIADTSELYQRLRVYAVMVGGIVALALGMAYLIGRSLQRQISEPVLDLARVATAVSERQDYTLRVTTSGEGELGQLTTAFNEMLTKIEAQNRSLSMSEARHRMLFENSPLPMWVIDLETKRFMAVNDAAVSVYGYSAAEFLGLTSDQLQPAERPADAGGVNGQSVPALDASAKIVRHRKKDDTGMLVETTSHDLPIDGRPSRLVLANDVTARVRAEQEIRRLNEELEYRVQQRTAQLEQANRELESFSYSVSHDLRAPLRHVQGYVAMLERSLGDQLTDKARRYLKTISDASMEMGQLIDDLLDFSRMGRVEMRETTVALDALLRECRPPLETAAQGRDIEWKIAPLPTVRGDPAMLRQVWANLLSNAVKYTRKREHAVIEVGSAGMDDGRVVCFVRDNGAGFDMQYAQKLFGVFQRLHRTDEFEGTGIGLASVRRIISRHGGRVWAEAEVDRGATFYFTLAPAERPRAAETTLL